MKLLEGRTEMTRHYPAILDTKDFKGQFLKGQPFNITSYIDNKGPIKSSYQDAMKGLLQRDRAFVVDKGEQSCGIGGVIPDPLTLTQTKQRLSTFRREMEQMRTKRFSYTGDKWF